MVANHGLNGVGLNAAILELAIICRDLINILGVVYTENPTGIPN